MHDRDLLIEARRWAKFPAVVLMCLAVVWLVDTYFEFNIASITQMTESFVGVVVVLVNMVFIPLGGAATGIGLLFVQRWAIWLGGIMILVMAATVTYDKSCRIQAKFALYRHQADTSQFGDAVMIGFLILGLWLASFVLLAHLYKAWDKLNTAQRWLKRSSRTWGGQDDPGDSQSYERYDDHEGDYCPLMPVIKEEADDD